MPRFTFHLDPLLRVRRRAERARQCIVAELERERIRLEDILRRRQRHIAAGKAALRDYLVGEVCVHDLRGQAAASMKMMSQAQRVVIELAGVHARLDAARNDLIGAARQRRAVEILREARLAEWKRDMDKRETATLDELAVIAAARRSPQRRESTGDGGWTT